MAQDDDLAGRNAAIRESKDRIAAIVASRASAAGLRALIAGGSVLTTHGLISPRVSPAASAIVSPGDLGALVLSLRELGWQTRKQKVDLLLLPQSITTLTHPDLAASLNLHSVIFGFHEDPDRVFEILWQRRRTIEVQGVDVPILDKFATMLLAAHNRLGGGSWAAGAHFDFFLDQFRQALSARETHELVELTNSLGASQELRPLLDGLGLDSTQYGLPTAEYTKARFGLDEVTYSDIWLLALAECPPGQRPAVMRNGARTVGSFIRDSAGMIISLERLLGARRRVAAKRGF